MKNEHVKVLIERQDGSISVMCFLTKTRLPPKEQHALDHWTDHPDDAGWFVREASESNIAEEIQRAGLDYISFEIADDEEVPTDLTFFNAWVKCPVNKVQVDMGKARKIHMDCIRAARNARLAELDKRKYGAEYDAERQKLRDLPQIFAANLDAASTPEQLKAIWPKELT